ncbi:hypothetical protein M501DRAFT_999324 [Patellaria atrata CBS 101060]|uniref:DUF924-domain-containing protein n=1 Tax=Patellaria atrata CBS 101060 TaxID=1346257 RepID=A0A9P4S4V2_9PEZI|nr:hypothetical protein M501DRAFT_999324 [Patellaria atrata CBS 101060]
MATLNKAIFNPSLYSRITALWFPDTSPSTIYPTMDAAKRWFGQGSPEEKAAFDNACASCCREALSSVSPEHFPLPSLPTHEAELAHRKEMAFPFRQAIWEGDIDNEVAGHRALKIMILLDQIPRNIFRKEDQRLIYTHYDVLARALIRDILSLEVRADVTPSFRYSLTARQWFYLPLMHSEYLADHDVFSGLIADMRKDFEKKPGEKDEAVFIWLDRIDEFELKHRIILERFGRYPYRNKYLGRETTKEEQEWLEGGGDTFGVS